MRKLSRSFLSCGTVLFSSLKAASGDIDRSVKMASAAAEGTRTTIERLETVVGRFKIQ